MQSYTVHNSERTCFAQCRHKWFLRYGLKIRPQHRGKALVIGSIWHDAMEVWWSAWKDPLSALRFAQGAIDQGCVALRESVGTFSTQHSSYFTGADVDEMHRVLLKMVEGYHYRYRSQDTTTTSNYGGSWPKITDCIMNETTLSAMTRTPQGTRSPWARYGGIVDKLVKDDLGQYWLIDHKTTSRSLDRWLNDHRYNPQATTYAWLVRETLGIEVAGIIYDLALKAIPPHPDDLPVLKGGAALSKRLPRYTTLRIFREALRRRGFRDDDQPWYRDKMAQLATEPDPFFRRELVRFRAEDLSRCATELYHVATELRRAHDQVGPLRAMLERIQTARDEMSTKAAAFETVKIHGVEWPRNGAACYLWNRPCEYMELCEHQESDCMDRMSVLEVTDYDRKKGSKA